MAFLNCEMAEKLAYEVRVSQEMLGATTLVSAACCIDANEARDRDPAAVQQKLSRMSQVQVPLQRLEHYYTDWQFNSILSGCHLLHEIKKQGMISFVGGSHGT